MKHHSDLVLFDFCYNLELCFCIINKNTTEQKKLVISSKLHVSFIIWDLYCPILNFKLT